MDILDKAQEVFGGHRYERYIATLCPFHDDSRPSFFIYEDTYRCSACGKFGNTEKLIQQFSNTYITPQVTEAYSTNPFTRWMRSAELSKVVYIAQENLKSSPSSYLRNRGISSTNQVALRLGLLENWVIFPIYNQYNKITGAIGRCLDTNVKSKYILPSGQDPDLLYVPDWSVVNTFSVVYLTFGIIDAISLWCNGKASMSTTTGKRLNPSALDMIRKKIVIVPDQGEEKEAQIIASKLGWRGSVLRLNYPDGTKDINDLVRNGVYGNVMV